jgi:hypothetical protein
VPEEPISLSPYNPVWPRLFAEERAVVARIIFVHSLISLRLAPYPS